MKDRVASLEADVKSDIANGTSKAEAAIKEIDEETKKSMLIPFDFWEYFYSLSPMEQMSVCLLMGNTGIILMLANIFSLYYGNYLIEKYNLEKKYPKIYYFILYRKKFERYYYMFSTLYILFKNSIEVLFSLAVLFNW